ncbi:NAD(P)-binding protein [Coccomyxa subellipsoidea C-169]|uniref:NAD(P)-binding protein n=1 Tax=Coccomyxa subellipsoidea (strain C-169) TaxID=574566 RepID=I0Z6U5_COCSC|nr:NAD(P)-binding protein [Coccomyxa subellipsoidea C-169]EIE26364.1 NAD(P)-binding protein [Coccomyxa subellipsoidea C-169]|eukprot:XP_005650908.1 NAD(P)-binding protein [Coccomyxa subellipsoidea C-169]
MSCYSGIGRETAATLVRRNAHVVLACRNAERGEKLRKELYEEGVQLLDVASLESVRSFAKSWQQQNRPLHMLVNNAGIFSMGAERSLTEDGFEAHMGTNHLGPFLLTMLLLPNLRQTAKRSNHSLPVRIVNVSSKMHELAPSIDTADPHFGEQKAYSSLAAYNRSKLAQILFTAELRRRLPGDCGVTAAAVHPGEVMTDVADNCYFGSDCRCSSPSKHALDPALGQWLWSWSADMVKLPAKYEIKAHSSS